MSLPIDISSFCHDCGLIFHDKTLYEDHMRALHHPKDLPVFVCEACGSTFDNENVLIDHELDHDAMAIMWFLWKSSVLSKCDSQTNSSHSSDVAVPSRRAFDSFQQQLPSDETNRDVDVMSRATDASLSVDNSGESDGRERGPIKLKIKFGSSKLKPSRGTLAVNADVKNEMRTERASRIRKLVGVQKPKSKPVTSDRKKPRPAQKPLLFAKNDSSASVSFFKNSDATVGSENTADIPKSIPIGSVFELGSSQPKGLVTPKLPSVSNSVTCPLCKDIQTKSSVLVRHMLEVHHSRLEQIKRTVVCNNSEADSVFDQDICHFCRASFPSKYESLCHTFIVHEEALNNVPVGSDMVVLKYDVINTTDESGVDRQLAVSVKFKRKRN